MSTLAPYPAYRNTDLLWLSHLPEHWGALQLRRVAEIRNGSDYKEVEIVEGGYPVYGSGGAFRRASAFLYDGESVLFGRKGTIDKPLHVTGRFWTVDTMFYTALKASVVGRYLFYYATTLPYSYYSTSTALPSMTQGDLSGHMMPLPPLTEQRVIADFLDRETGQIDRLIGKQERLVETLRERRAAVVNNVLWSGLEGAERAATGIGPVPSAPQHWLRLRNKALLRERLEVSTGGSEELLTVSHLTGVTPRSEKDVNMFEAESLEGYRIVQSGDLVINTMWAWMGALGVSEYDGIVSPAYGVYQVVRPELFEKRFFGYLYRSQAYVTEMTRFSRGVWTSRLRLYPESFLRLWVVAPPLPEQRAIADYLDVQTAAIDGLIAKAQLFIELARERRAALITAAVTGRIDVRGAA